MSNADGRVPVPSRTSSSAAIPDDVPSAAAGPHEAGNEVGFRAAVEHAGAIAAAEEKPGRQRHRKKKEVSAPKTQNDKLWEERFNELVAYKEVNGNCNVPRSQGALGLWVDTQRTTYKRGKLSQERTAQLEGIVFNWGTQREEEIKPWEERFNELAAYKEKNGDCNVPQRLGTLGSWVNNQRKLHKKGTLPQECTAQLEGVGFVWKLKRGPSTASTQAQSDLPADGNHEEAGRGSNDFVAALPPLPPVQEDIASESNTLPSNSPLETND